MNDMNGDYLWDRTGEPDPEIEQLEEILGSLRYQPRPLEIPASVEPGTQRFHFSGSGSHLVPRLAIAAAIAAVVLGLGLWVGMQRRPAPEVAKTESAPASSTETTQAAVVSSKASDNTAPLTLDRGEKPRPHRSNPRVNSTQVNRGVVAANMKRNRRPGMNDSKLAAEERKEAEAAKQQLMLALRLASSKLNFAQKKTQGANPENQIHNQHKIG